MALRCLQLGCGVTMIEVPRRDIGGVEIIPSAARHLLSELRLDAGLAAIRPGFGAGMLRYLGDGAPEFREGRSLHVDRLALRRAIIAQAASRGAEIRRLRQLPPPDDGVFAGAFAAIDATGRRAAWSRPVIRYGRAVADLFAAPGSTGGDAALLVGLGRAWAYAAADQAGTTIGVVHDGRLKRPELEHAVRARFGFGDAAPLAYLGRRPAFPQAAAAPLRGRVIAIGDAAFSHDPIGGRGLSFALGSAFAAASVVQTWRDHPARSPAASAYYQDYVAAEKDRHLAFLATDRQRSAQLPPSPLPPRVLWSAREARAPLALAGGIETAEIVLTGTGARVRWLARFDILEMRALCTRVQPTGALVEALCGKGLTPAEARAAVEWALGHGILRAADAGD